MIKLVIIDIDDTLILTEEACFKMENHIAQKMGFSPMSRQSHLKNWGTHLKAAIVERIPGIDADEFMKNIDKIMPEFIKRKELDIISEINYETLDKIKKLGMKIAILTSRTIAEAKHLLHADHELNRRIEAFYHKENMPYLKPDPRVFDIPLNKFNVRPYEAVYIGDAPNDAKAAKGAGLHFIALMESGIRTKEDFKNLKVDFFASNFPEIIGYLTKNS
ncbi:MAG: hypothetical protein UR68_C0020G0037 [Candidatus Roizmanbacteria bacterium GW2011_GWA2_35_19]|uniref:Uncharacterized protein n=2 Tax=Candidatus Roizmaniibacteriota TaxID=1752723 RepID=A0A0G0EYF8_9BACT|nr:MAG: hypothetical protein UR63_C0033G0002 [Candidatus Roizmanbacteria bacterium GW2011_GWC2_35_12]KKP72182.1 MAG: hypothetical protein UR68_C0020G0037 [Candidatus Roizmanbacteria bacterium GW2011_GWA2_35_19]